MFLHTSLLVRGVISVHPLYLTSLWSTSLSSEWCLPLHFEISDFHFIFLFFKMLLLKTHWFYLFIGITFPFLWLYINIKNSTFQYHFCTKLTIKSLCKREKVQKSTSKALTFAYQIWYNVFIGVLFAPLFLFLSKSTTRSELFIWTGFIFITI